MKSGPVGSTNVGVLNGRKRDLFAALLARQGIAASSGVIDRQARRDEFPLSFAQHRLWMLDQIEPGCHYNDPFALRLHGPLEAWAIQDALNEIVRRHESLRTSFGIVDDRPVQRIAEMLHIVVPVVDISHHAADDREREALRLAIHESRKRFDLATGPLLRAKLVRLGADDHVLALTFHHVALDGWSRGVFLREFTAIYDALVERTPPPLHELSIQYGDFAVWQRSAARAELLRSQLGYWKRQLDGAPVVTEIRPDRARPRTQKHDGGRCWFSVGKQTTDALHELAAREGCTPFMVLVGAFQTLIARYTDRTDILIGSPIANRSVVEAEGLIGCFLNMLVLRTDLSGDPTFREALVRVKEATVGAYSNQDLPFERLIEELHPPRDLSRSPLFQLAFILQDPASGHIQGRHLAITHFDIDNGTAKYDLTISVISTAQGLSAWAEFDTSLFAASTIQRLTGHYVTLLDNVVRAPDRRLSEIPLMADEERARILAVCQGPDLAYPRNQTVHALFEDQARRTPRAVAVEYEGRRLTYAALNERADTIAALLRRHGACGNVLVGLCIERSLDLPASVLGTLKSGAAYLPLDPAFPSERLAVMIEDSKVSIILTQHKLLDRLPPSNTRVLCVDDPVAVGEALDSSPPTVGQPEDLAYVLFTSGSTGRPKGVQVPHRALVNFLWSMKHEPGIGSDDVLMAVTTLSFDIAGLELLLPLIVGAKVVIASREVAMDGPRLADLLGRCGVTIMQATPTTWRMLIDSGWRGSSRFKVLCGGEALDDDLAEKLLTRCGELWNMYGPTETTVWSTTTRVSPGETITIGRPIANTTIHILDARMEPVPVGVAGELYIGGDGVARGYLNRPDLTRERFVASPFHSTAARLYKTGDLARLLADGRIEFLGRGDTQVKIRGYRIELGEIEAALARLSGVAEAAVTAREDAPGQKRLVAYVAARRPDDTSVAALKAALRLQLPDYMIPATIIVLDRLPLTPNGKIDRKALPPPDALDSPLDETYEAPQGETEEKLARAMAALLRVPRVGRADSFFDLGGHSILALAFFNAIEREFGRRLSLATLFQAPTVKEIAAIIGTRDASRTEWASLVPIQTQGTKPRFFCVHGAGGNVLLYRELARHLGTDYPFYGLQSQGLDGKTPFLTTIEEMAEQYVHEIRSVQPEGPYSLGGYCLGGTVAYEMAQQLRDAGEEVRLLVLLDTYNFHRMKQPDAVGLIRQKLMFHIGNVTRMSVADWPSYLRSKLRVARDGEWASLWTRALREMLPFQPRGAAREQPAATSVPEANDLAANAYRPKPYTGRVTVFKPRVNYDFLPDPQMGWGELVLGQLDVVQLEMNPHAMLTEPYVRELARHLRIRLDELDGETSADLVAVHTPAVGAENAKKLSSHDVPATTTAAT
jgi:amino acid adenylation domain-containing protein